jgi:hypothetical protein
MSYLLCACTLSALHTQVTYENADSQNLLFNPSHLTQLRSIQVALPHRSPTASLTDLLSNLSSPRLEQVAFHLNYPEGGDRNGTLPGWDAVDALLQSSPFDGLKEVYFDCIECPVTLLIDRISRCMSQCRARRILTICESDTRELIFYGMGAGGLSETFGCGLTLWDH